jgi:hypothetical protein
MTPTINAPADDPEITEFCYTEGRRGPLLRPVDLWTGHVRRAQQELIRDLDTFFNSSHDRLLRRFQKHNAETRDRGQTANNRTVWERRLSDHPSFQIHRYKLFEGLVEYLRRRDLAWEPSASFSDGPEYLEMNPRLGEAIMATLATACAESEGLQVVTEFPELHGQLIGTPRDSILKACLSDSRSAGRTSGQVVAEFLVYRRCNVDALTADRIAALKSERDALAEFRTKIENLASTLPPTIQNKKVLEVRLNDLMNDIFHQWQSEQANLSSYARRLFGEGVLTEPEKLVQKIVENAVRPENLVASAAGAAVVGGAHLGSLTLAPATGAAAGFVVAVVFRALRTWGETMRTARESPFRYLTTLQNEGVTFSLTR